MIWEFLTSGPGAHCCLSIPPLLIAALAGAGLGGLSNMEKKKQEEADRKLQAATAQWSPWTGLAPRPVKLAGPMSGDVLKGGLAGASFGSQFGGAGAAGGGGSSFNWGQSLAPQQSRLGVNYSLADEQSNINNLGNRYPFLRG